MQVCKTVKLRMRDRRNGTKGSPVKVCGLGIDLH